MTEVREFNDIADLDSLESAWQSLLDKTPNADFFRTLDWLRVYWQHFGETQRLRVLVVHEDGKPFGIVPLVIRREWYKLGPFRVLTYPLDDWGSLYGPIGQEPDKILAAALDHINKTRRDWDFIELRWVEGLGVANDPVADVLRAARFTAQEREQDAAPIVDLSQTWDQYWSERKGSWRGNCRRNERKMQKVGEVRYVRYRPTDNDPRWDLYDACEQIAMSSWQGSSTTGTTITHESVRPFLRDMHVAAVSAGAVDINLIFVDDQPAAFSYNYFYRGYVSGLRLGFDARFRSQGAGTVMTWHMIRDSFERGDHTFDFLPGSLEVKRNWQTRVVQGYRYGHYPLTCGRAQLLRLKRWVFDRTSSPSISS